uniref:Uncharacterized protein n=1 Tax=viral metagenome TaxID=1070528 RepID=A0A6M3KX18_9ZZZZ
MKRAELEKKAKDLSLDFTDETTDEELVEAIKEAEDDIDDNKDIDFYKNEFDKAKQRRDAALKDKRILQKKLDTLSRDLESRPTKEDYETAKTQLDELLAFKNTVEEELETKKLASLDETDKLKLRLDKAEKKLDEKFREGKDTASSEFEKQLGVLTEKVSSYEKQIGSLRTMSLENEIIKAAVKGKAIEPSHIVRMLKGEFTFDPDLRKFINQVRDEKGNLKEEFEVDEYISNFLAKEENDYLVGENVNKDSFRMRDTNKDKHVKTSIKDKNDRYDPKDPKIIELAEDAGLKVEDWIETRKLRDARFDAIAEKEKLESQRKFG